MEYYKIGQQIRNIRKVRQLSQEELAEQVGISTTHMSHIETGNTKLSLPVLVKLASVLEVSTDDILCGTPERTRKETVGYIEEILDSCTLQQTRVIEEIVRAAVEAMKIYL